MRRLLLVPALIATLVVVVGACGDGDDGGGDAGTVPPVTSSADEPQPTQPPSTPPTSTPTSGAPGPRGSLPPGDTDVARAIADVVARTGGDAAAVTVVADEEVTWRDAAVGCPQKGMVYPQVLTDGRRVVLELDGRRFDYHSGGARDLFFCARPQPPAGQ